MPKLKLGPLVDEKPVKLTVELPAQVHRDLLAYAEALGRETGAEEPVEAVKLVAPMLARFMATDRAFAAARRIQSGATDRSAVPSEPRSSGEHATGSGSV